eukprot:11422663-Prorocentrum_lima.AAC.1
MCIRDRLKRSPCSLTYRKIPMPWCVYAFPDSAFRAMEPDCLAVRALVVAIASDRLLTHGGELSVMEVYSKKQPR